MARNAFIAGQDLATRPEPQAPSGTEAHPKRIFFGWWILLSATLTTICCGAIIYGFPVYYEALIKQFHWSRAAITFGFFLVIGTSSASALVYGHAIDRYGARKVLIVGTVICSLAYIGLSFIHGLPSYYVFCILVGMGWAGMAYVPNSTLVSRWFVRRRGTALGIVTAVGALGGAIAPILITFLTLNIGWRGSYILIGTACLLIPLVPLTMVVRDTPQSINLQPDGAGGPSQPVSTASKRLDANVGFLAAISNPHALAIFGGLLCAGFFIGATTQHLILYLREQGFSPYLAPTILSLQMVFSLVGRLGFGLTSDKVSIRFASTIFFLFMAVSSLLIFFVKIPGVVYLFVLCHGLGHGGITAFTPVVLSTLFPERYMGKNLAIGFTIYTVGVASGAPLNGHMYDVSGNYFYAFVLNVVIAMTGTILTLLFGIPRTKVVPVLRQI